ncbi:MAG: chemotaxis protein CheX [Tissierellia bacterium]|nr:chemotaxis protein CheX [Tissierellia bacterium]
MKAEYINSFYIATQDVFKLMFDLDVEKNGLTVVEDMVPVKDLSVSLGVTGDLKGTILFSFTDNMSLNMVEIMSGMKINEIDTFVSSALGEVANIIGGNALTNLSNNNYICDITPPQVFVGQHKTVSFPDEKTLVINLETDIGDFDINIFLRENQNG